MIGWGRRKKQNCNFTRKTSEKAKWVSVDTRRQEPGLKGTVSMSVELSISAVQLRHSTPAYGTFKSSTFIYKREERPADNSKKSHPRREKQLNFFSSVTEKWGVDVPPWRDNTKSQTTTALWPQKDKSELVDHSCTPWRELYSYFSLSPTNFTPAEGF